MMKVGGIEIHPSERGVLLRMPNRIGGRPAADLCPGEIRKLIANLERCLCLPALPLTAPTEAAPPAEDDLIG